MTTIPSNVHTVTTNELIAGQTRQIYDLVGNPSLFTGPTLTFVGCGGDDVNVSHNNSTVAMTNTQGMRVDDLAHNTILSVSGGVGLFISDFGHDPTGHIYLNNEGFENGHQAYAHLVADSAGTG